MLDARHVWLADLRKKKEAEKRLVFEEWCSTSLPPGEYRISFEVSKISVVPAGKAVSENQVFTPSMRLEFPLTVLSRNDGAVRREFAALLETDRQPTTTPEDRLKRAHAVELIAYARSTAALPYQIALLSGDVPMLDGLFIKCHAIDLALHLIECGSREEALGLVRAFSVLNADESAVGPVERDVLSRVVLWAIHELHARGNPEVVEATEAIVSAYEKPRDPRPVPGLD